MADSLDSSLRRSLLLGLQVLERASKRRVDWSRSRDADHWARSRDADHRLDWARSGDADHRLGPTLCENTVEAPAQREQISEELTAAFSAIAGFMSQTSAHCQRYHRSRSASSLSELELRHVRRFHSSPGHSALRPAPQLPDEDVHLMVSPGTASDP